MGGNLFENLTGHRRTPWYKNPPALLFEQAIANAQGVVGNVGMAFSNGDADRFLVWERCQNLWGIFF